jgi:membrane associated rhomboid family serine protease
MFVLISFLIYIIVTLFIGSLLFPTPLSDNGNVRYSSLPIMTFLLIFVNAMAFMLFQGFDFYQGINALDGGDLGTGLDLLNNYVQTIWMYGYRGALLRESLGIGAMSTFTSMFMHSDMWHLLGNMIFLWAFGRRVEDACGPWRFLVFYLCAGMVANIGSEILNPSQVDLPGIGASGAISGVMGAYLILFPNALVTCFWGIGIVLRFIVVAIMKVAGVKAVKEAPTWRWTIQLPGWLLLIYFLFRDLVPSLETIQQGQDFGGVNNLAHLTGFLAAIVIFLFTRKDLVTRYFSGRAI